ncbi:MAG: 3-dehydroquinate synthase [Ruminococcaceae bacterium]|nr:3-dehydroquinate synthase [Oscillospiraceae bacterium]
MRRVEIDLREGYTVYIEQGLLDNCGEYIEKICTGKRAVIVSDSNVAPLYAQRVADSLKTSGFETGLFTIPAGEESKNPENLVKCADFCAESGLTRSDVIVALGGGVITDMAGLCGALYQRGIAVCQIPTSLLAMVDSSVGGKTAVNLSKGKNMFGAFYQPSLVLCDSTVLSTLPSCEFANGMAEVIKYAVLRGGKVREIIDSDNLNETLDELIEECVKIKKDYVCEDEFDTGARQFLNLGHTIGHAIERRSNFSIPHGSAVSAGMCIVARACAEMSLCSSCTAQYIETVCAKYNLPTSVQMKEEELFSDSLSDKKRMGDKVTMVLIREIGDCYLEKTDVENIKNYINKGM